MTSNLSERVSEHKAKRNEGFSATYDVTRLVWFTRFDLIVDAIAREKTMKGWPRQWKINLIEETNPDWDELVMDFDDCIMPSLTTPVIARPRSCNPS